MTTIGTAVLQIIPSLDGVSKSIDKQLGGTLRASGKKSGKDFGTGIADGLKDAEASYEKLRNKAEDSLGKIRIAEANLTKARSSGDNARIITAEEKLNTARRNSSISVRDAKTAHDALKTSQDGLSGSSSGLGGVLDGLGGKLSTVGVIAGGAALVGVAALGAGVVLVATQLYELGAQFDDTFDNIRIKTGATGPVLKQLEESTKSLSTKVPLSIGEIGNVVAETSRALHLTGPELDNTARSIANLGRLTGENVDIRTLGKAFRGFGVDAKDQVPALDSLLQASQATGVPINELLATVVKGGAGLRQLGFDFGESAALATQFEDAGLDADKAMTGLTKGLAGLAKDGKTGQDALKGTVGEIKNLLATGQDAAALDLTNKLFGAKGGVQFFEAIKNGSLDLDTLADSINNTGDTISQAAADTDDWAERWQTFKNQIAVGLEPIATGVFDAVNTQLTSLADWVSGHQTEVIEFFGRVGDAAITGAQGILTFASSSLRALGDLIKGLGDSFGPVFESFSKIGDVLRFVPGFQDIGNTMKTIGDAGGAINDAFAKAPDLLNKGADAIDRWGTKLPGVKTAWDAIVERTADATTFTEALGDATASVPDGKEIKLSANTPEVVEGLKKLGIEVVNLPDGSIGVTANTDEGKRIIQAFRDQQIGAPLNLPVGANTNQARLDVDAFAQAIAGRAPIQIPIAATPGAPGAPTPQNPFAGPFPRASGGPITGAGGPRSDIIPIWASNGEHMLPADEVGMMGGQAGVYRFRSMLRAGTFGGGGEINWLPGEQKKREPLSPGNFNPNVKLDTSLIKMLGEPGVYGMLERTLPEAIPGLAMDPAKYLEGFKRGDVTFSQWASMVMGTNRGWMQHLDIKPKSSVWPPHFAGGGAVGPDVQAAGALVGTPYSQANRTDCSGMVARVIDRTLGLPESGLMSTKNAADWLAARGFKKGIGGPGTISVGWYDHGPNPNDGHMSMTLSDGSNAEAGGGVGDIFQIGGGAAGASDPQFDQHMFLPTVYGEGAAGSSTTSPFAGGSAIAAMTGAVAATPTSVSGGGTSSSSGGGGSSFSLPSSIGDLAGFGLANLGKGVGTTKSGSDLSLFGEAAGAAVSGQVDSALGVLGVNGSPGWLQAISTLVGGISIGGGGSAAPLSATSTGMGTPPPDDPGNMHGTRAGQQPGPGVTYNITARDTEDAFIKAQRIEREKAAAKLSRF